MKRLCMISLNVAQNGPETRITCMLGITKTDEHTPKRPRRHNFWSLTTSLSLAEADGDAAPHEWTVNFTELVVLLTVGGVAGVAALCRALIVRRMHADTATPLHDIDDSDSESESEPDSGSASTVVSVDEDSSEEEIRLVSNSCVFNSFCAFLCASSDPIFIRYSDESEWRTY